MKDSPIKVKVQA